MPVRECTLCQKKFSRPIANAIWLKVTGIWVRYWGKGHGTWDKFAERGTRNEERGTGNGERGTGNGERGTGNGVGTHGSLSKTPETRPIATQGRRANPKSSPSAGEAVSEANRERGTAVPIAQKSMVLR